MWVWVHLERGRGGLQSKGRTQTSSWGSTIHPVVAQREVSNSGLMKSVKMCEKCLCVCVLLIYGHFQYLSWYFFPHTLATADKSVLHLVFVLLLFLTAWQIRQIKFQNGSEWANQTFSLYSMENIHIIWCFILQSTHTLTIENKRQHAFDAAFKLRSDRCGSHGGKQGTSELMEFYWCIFVLKKTKKTGLNK